MTREDSMSPGKQLADKDLIQALLLDYASTVKAGDIDRYLSLWIHDGKQMPPGAPARIGLEQIREGEAPMMELFDVERDAFPDEVRILGDSAYSHGNFKYTITPKEGGETVRGEGKYLTIFLRQTDGSWKIAIDCYNDNAPRHPS